MATITVKLKKRLDTSYKIFIQKDSAKNLLTYLKHSKYEKYAIVTDSTVLKLYGKPLARYLRKNDIDTEIFSFPAGEKSKRLTTVEKLAEEMIEKGCTRKSCILALGGGVVGDTASFLAAIYLRGIPYVHIPTTLLAMTDSAIGGKTGVDLISGKNLIGTITQPQAVFIDPSHLKTLPCRQIRNGLAEVIKYGVIRDDRLFKFIEQNLDKILKLEEKSINHIIEESARIKAEVVEKDEQEKNLRMILNYGHTFGHALEKMSHYTLLHGYAISIGMVLANEMAVKKGYLDQNSADRIKKLFKRAGLSTTTMKKPKLSDMLNDKKRTGNWINFVLPTRIGEVILHKEKCQ